jgi:hypothetical protein
MHGAVQKILLAFALVSCLTLPLAAASSHDNSRALTGLTAAKVYFDVSLKDDNLLVVRMELLDKTITQMEDAGLEVSAVVGFRGGASRFITKDDHYVLRKKSAIRNKSKNG